jgi:hypothetical protein
MYHMHAMINPYNCKCILLHKRMQHLVASQPQALAQASLTAADKPVPAPSPTPPTSSPTTPPPPPPSGGSSEISDSSPPLRPESVEPGLSLFLLCESCSCADGAERNDPARLPAAKPEALNSDFEHHLPLLSFSLPRFPFYPLCCHFETTVVTSVV